MQTAETTYSRRRRMWLQKRKKEEEGALPTDPRDWSREDVAHWVFMTTNRNKLPPVPASNFPMNGKALCLMTPDMFLLRAPVGGKLLYKDFQLRLCAALYGSDFLRNVIF